MSKKVYPDGAPPNLRVVKSCGTCKHADWGYEGEISCKRFESYWDWEDGSAGDPFASDVLQFNVCDAHEPEAAAPTGEKT